MKIYAFAQVEKLREYRKSYGSPEVIEVFYIIENENSIELLNERGSIIRTMRKGTKVLINWSGKEITERTLKGRTKKATKDFETRRAESMEIQRKERSERLEAENKQAEMLRNYFNLFPSKLEKFKRTIEVMSSKKWRAKVKLLAVRGINDEKFEGFLLSPSRIKEIVYSQLKQNERS